MRHNERVRMKKLGKWIYLDEKDDLGGDLFAGSRHCG